MKPEMYGLHIKYFYYKKNPKVQELMYSLDIIKLIGLHVSIPHWHESLQVWNNKI